VTILFEIRNAGTARPRPRSAAFLCGVLAVALMAAVPAAAETEAAATQETAQAAIFAADAFVALPTGTRLSYAHLRSLSPSDPRLPDIADGRAELTIETAESDRRRLRLTLTENGATRPVPPFPADAGHPVLLVFLETIVRTMSTTTGGNAYYIRNRIREALWEGGETGTTKFDHAGTPVAADRTTIRPFAEDPNRDRMGPFANLELSFLLSDAVPGRIAALEALAEPPDGTAAFRESYVFSTIEGGN
jgi:hypothetical protein